MEAEFVNTFISKQRAMIDELISKNLLLETRVAVLETKVSDLSSQIDSKKSTKAGKEEAKDM
jgi:hypothetical protein